MVEGILEECLVMSVNIWRKRGSLCSLSMDVTKTQVAKGALKTPF
jgi:hypothetical protein